MNSWISALTVKAFNSALSLLALFIVTRHFGAAGKGHVAEALLPATTLMLLIKFGVDTAAAISSRRNEMARNGFLGAIFLYFVTCSVFVMVVSSEACAGVWDSILPNVPLDFIAPALWLIPFQASHDALMNAILGVSSFVRFNVVKLFQPMIFMALLAILLFGNWLSLDDSSGIVRVIWLYPVSYAIAALLMVVLLRGTLPFVMKDSLKVFLSLLQIGGSIHLAFLLLYLNRRIDTWVIQRYLDPEDNGIYSVAVAFLEAAWFVSRPMSSLVLQQNSKSLNPEITGRVLRASMMFSTLYLAALASFGSWLLSLAGDVFPREGYRPMLILMPGILLFNLLQVLSQVLYALGSPRRVVGLALAALFLNLILNLALVGSHGLVGIALASTLSYSVLGAGILWMVGREMQVPLLSLVVPQASDFAFMPRLWNSLRSGKIQR